MRYFREIFGTDAPYDGIPHRDAISFCAFGQEVGQFTGIQPLHMTMRRDLDHALVQAALAAGATDLTGQRVDAIDADAPTVTLRDQCITAPLMVAADGVNSATARALFGRAFDPQKIGFALEVEVPTETPPDTPVRIDFGAADWGYGWDFPKVCGRTIGVGGMMQRNTDLKASLATYLSQLGVTTDSPVKGQFLPFGSYRRIPGQGTVLLVGDAAGLVDPITGEGIAYAMKSGQLAAQSAIGALHRGNPGSALPRYRAALRPIHRAIDQARMIRPLIFLPACRSGFISGFRNSSTLRTEYMRLLAGETEYGQITRRTIARLPRFIVRSLTN
ncbi:hypothetical protein SAMN06265370_1284 [Puniceibacterium sediminis]|uniref:Geranylgeranyl reductase family n=2 Tax=Puniceibacterium sediminis TaxID=1608407 RepID=A0A238ZBM3_9RHOB|nr:hypothetical protein SAMN06265370_1284 [Puniceibacterium sediminis]